MLNIYWRELVGLTHPFVGLIHWKKYSKAQHRNASKNCPEVTLGIVNQISHIILSKFKGTVNFWFSDGFRRNRSSTRQKKCNHSHFLSEGLESNQLKKMVIGVFRTQLKMELFSKIVNSWKCPSLIFDSVFNTPLHQELFSGDFMLLY